MRRVYIPIALRQMVIDLAGGRCEYCLIHQDDTPFTHQFDHFIPLKHGGKTAEGNLVLACLDCNRHKGSDIAAIDPVTEEITPLFNPRLQDWKEHFFLQNARIIGQTPIGRATVGLLRLNQRERILQRHALIRVERYMI